jgi:aspartate aminotransferase
VDKTIIIQQHTPTRVKNAIDAMLPFSQYLSKYQEWVRNADNEGCDFAFGNPHDMPLPAFVQALQKATVPENKDWYAYKINEPEAVKTVSESLQQQFEQPFEPEDIFLTNGATGALDVVFNTVLNYGDEVIFNSPPWFFYEGMILNSGGVPVRVNIDYGSFDLDLAAIEAAITDKTRLIIVNSPNNPTGKIYPPETLSALADILTRASQRHGRTIYLLSDEAYRRIVYKGRKFSSPTTFYSHSFMVYTYGKTLLTPGQRLGYIALPPTMPKREQMRTVLFSTQVLSGFSITNALLQHALPDIEPLYIDIEHLQYKRDWLVSALQDIGYDVHSPEGTFYLLPHSPIDDDVAFTDSLAAEEVFCLPGKVVEMPGYFRISLTANDKMIEKAIPSFAAAFRRAG